MKQNQESETRTLLFQTGKGNAWVQNPRARYKLRALSIAPVIVRQLVGQLKSLSFPKGSHHV